MKPSTFYAFGPWLPDLPELNNPGMTEALNVLPMDGVYQPFRGLATLQAATLSAIPIGAYGAANGSFEASYFGTATRLYMANVQAGTQTDLSAATYNASNSGLESNFAWSFAQYKAYLIATDLYDRPQYQEVASGSNFATLGSATEPAPQARYVGVVNQFLVFGNTAAEATAGGGNTTARWSSIDNIQSWPVPGSSTAIASQSGDQDLGANFGPVTGISGGDQYGLIFQRNAVNRMTYIGPPAVFQFDRISDSVGAAYPFSVVKIAGFVYFVGMDGFYVTDGVSVKPIGDGKVDQFFQARVTGTEFQRVVGAADIRKNLIYWAFADTTASDNAERQIIIYNYKEDRFSRATQTLYALHSANVNLPATNQNLRAFNSAKQLCEFSGSVGTAILATGEVEFDPGDYSHLAGFKPLITGTTPAVTVAIGTRNTQDPNDLTYTSETTATARTGFCDFRAEARYHRARVTITGPFDKAMGGEPYIEASGED